MPPTNAKLPPWTFRDNTLYDFLFAHDAFRCVDHRFRRTSCDGSVTSGHETPRLNQAESRCIRETSCDDLVRTHTCERAAARRTDAERWTRDGGASG